VHIHVFYSDCLPTAPDDWQGTKYSAYEQVGADLGARMYSAFQTVFEANGASKQVVIVGSDSPELSVELLDSAFRALQHSDFVIGPTFDGGYYLLGMNSPSREVFEGIEWSTETVCQDTQRRIFKQGKSIIILQKLHDIDVEEDYKALHRFFKDDQ
jgi:rSAM/selenodomain-associated transferase 1